MRSHGGVETMLEDKTFLFWKPTSWYVTVHIACNSTRWTRNNSETVHDARNSTRWTGNNSETVHDARNSTWWPRNNSESVHDARNGTWWTTSVLWYCWLRERKGIWIVKELDVGLLVMMIWLELCTTYSCSSPVVSTTSIILSFNGHRLTQVHLENGRENGQRERERERVLNQQK